MTYIQLLQKYIKDSGLSLREISRRCEELGQPVSQAYISKILNGEANSPSERILKILAEVTGGDPNVLINAEYYEKAPDEIKLTLDRATAYKKIIDYIIRKKPITVAYNGPKQFFDIQEFKDEVDFVNSPEFLNNFTDKEMKEVLDEIFFDMASDEPNTLSEILELTDFYTKVSKPNLLNEELVPYSTDKMFRAPVLGSIRAGEPLDRIEYNEGFTLVDPDLLRGRDGFALKVKGDSMSGDRILEGDIVIVVKQEEVLPSDIAVVAINGDEATLKRVKLHGEMVMLVPSNPAYEPTLLPAKDIHIIGKVVEVKFWPK